MRVEHNGKMTFVYFSPVRLALTKEMINHPALIEHLSKHDSAEFEVRLAETARFCGVALDGVYDPQDVDNICELCLRELQLRSMGVILSPHQKFHHSLDVQKS